MVVREYNRGQAQEAMKEWIDNYPNLPSIDSDFVYLRNDIQAMNKRIREEIDNDSSIKRGDYYLDYMFGLSLYDYFSNQQGFSLRVASNDGFWRFLSVKVVPDVVSQRWGKDNESHFWSQPSRIWLRSLWWYVHLSWQGSAEETKKVLSCDHFTTDTILNFEERTGRKGTHINAYRRIIKYYSLVSEDVIRKSTRGKLNNNDDIFRVVMKLNTAKLLVMDPSLFEGGEEAYAKSLFKDAGVDFDAS